MLRSLVKAQLDAPRDAQAQTGLQQMLADYFAITIRGKFRIGFFTSEQVNGHGRRILNLMTRADFTAWAENKPEGELWLKNPQRREYLGLITNPDKPAEWERKLNLWAGFGIEPREGNAEPFTAYVHTILAQGQDAWAAYISNWLAWVVQNPGERIGVALCLISAKEGTGKGTLGNLMLTLFGQHGRSVSRSEGLTGHFNAHLADALYVFADEALFAGDLRGADAFKNIVTEPWIAVTPKGVDSIEMENRLSIVMATNHNWAATVGWSDRRFAMFEVSEVPQTRAYWEGLHNWLKAGGKNIVLDFLIKRDLSGWHPVDDRPMTPVYMDQRRQSLRETHRWWHEVLEAEDLAVGTGTPAPVINDKGEVGKKELYALYKRWHRQNEHAASRAASAQVFWRDFWAMTKGAVDEHRPKAGEDGSRGRVVTLPIFPTAGAIPLPPFVTTSSNTINWELLFTRFEEWLAQK